MEPLPLIRAPKGAVRVGDTVVFAEAIRYGTYLTCFTGLYRYTLMTVTQVTPKATIVRSGRYEAHCTGDSTTYDNGLRLLGDVAVEEVLRYNDAAQVIIRALGILTDGRSVDWSKVRDFPQGAVHLLSSALDNIQALLLRDPDPKP